VEAFSAGGFDAPLNWYRAIDLNWSLTAFAQEQRILQPALFIVGEDDPVRHYAGSAEAGLKDWVPNLSRSVVVPGAGHWIQQEKAEAVNALLLAFLKDLPEADGVQT
jgi:pimeloyl-ACP methyl ester carboxylesterase